MPVKVDINKNWSTAVNRDINVGFLDMVTDIHQRSTILVPKDTRALANSGKIETNRNGFKITYGSVRVPYARRQFYENRRSSHWLTRAADGAIRGSIAKYFRIGK